jgi:hypothetical protein
MDGWMEASKHLLSEKKADEAREGKEEEGGGRGSASGCRQHRNRTTTEETPIGGLQTPKVAIIAERRAGGTSHCSLDSPLLYFLTNGSKHTVCGCDVWLGRVGGRGRRRRNQTDRQTHSSKQMDVWQKISEIKREEEEAAAGTTLEQEASGGRSG